MSEFKKILTEIQEAVIQMQKIENPECEECGGLGGAIEVDEEHGEMWVPCFKCWVDGMEQAHA